MERVLSVFYVYPLLIWGAWERLRGRGNETTEEYLRRKYPHLITKDWTD